MWIGRRAAALLALVSVLATGLPVTSEAQQAPRVAARSAGRASGWIGIDLDVNTTWVSTGSAPAPAMVIAQVYDGSPAQRAGLQPGDSIVRINQRPVSWDEVTRLQASLEPGREVSFQLRRDGRLQTVRLRADARPADDELAVLPPDIRYQVRSAQAMILQHLDSAARVNVAGSGEGNTRTLVMFRSSGDSMLFSFPAYGAMRISGDDGDGARAVAFPAPAPFEGVIVRQPPSAGVVESLRTGMEPPQRPIVTPIEAMRREMEAAAQALATREEHRRPLAPYIFGQNGIAGATLAPLNPGLSDYFAVSEGLLIVEVVDDTPAADAGVLPGDVIVASGRRSVSTVEELRAIFRSYRAGDSVPLTLVRKNRRIEVAVPR